MNSNREPGDVMPRHSETRPINTLTALMAISQLLVLALSGCGGQSHESTLRKAVESELINGNHLWQDANSFLWGSQGSCRGINSFRKDGAKCVLILDLGSAATSDPIEVTIEEIAALKAHADPEFTKYAMKNYRGFRDHYQGWTKAINEGRVQAVGWAVVKAWNPKAQRGATYEVACLLQDGGKWSLMLSNNPSYNSTASLYQSFKAAYDDDTAKEFTRFK